MASSVTTTSLSIDTSASIASIPSSLASDSISSSSLEIVSNFTSSTTNSLNENTDDMKLSTILSSIALVPTALSAPSTESHDEGKSCCVKDIGSFEFQQNLANNYLKMWGGDLKIAEQILHKDLVMHADRLPSANGSDLLRVTSREGFEAFIQKSRTGWSKYWFDLTYWVGNGNQMALRWKMNGIVGKEMPLPT